LNKQWLRTIDQVSAAYRANHATRATGTKSALRGLLWASRHFGLRGFTLFPEIFLQSNTAISVPLLKQTTLSRVFQVRLQSPQQHSCCKLEELHTLAGEASAAS
jgi:hypothetical protein